MGRRHVHAVRPQFRPRPDTPLVILVVVVGVGGFLCPLHQAVPIKAAAVIKRLAEWQ